MAPRISIVLNTARTSYAMSGMPRKHHLEYTCESLAKQDFQDFELIVVDMLRTPRRIETLLAAPRWWAPLERVGIPVYHVPVRPTPFVDRGYVAISATKNSGALYAEGELLLFLDDCTYLDPSILGRFFTWSLQNRQATFVAGLHARLIGTEYTALDSRFRLLDALGTNVIDDRPVATYGYPSCSREAFYRINGFDEMFDGSRQLEDADFGERLQVAGYQIVLDRSVVIHEQEHLRIQAWPDDKDPARSHVEDDIKWKPNLKCNGTWIFMKDGRVGQDRYLANHRKLTVAEWAGLRVCPYRVFDGAGSGFCGRHGPVGVAPPCNWMEGKVESHMVLPDSQLYNELEPVWFKDLAPGALAQKDSYRCC